MMLTVQNFAKQKDFLIKMYPCLNFISRNTNLTIVIVIIFSLEQKGQIVESRRPQTVEVETEK
jgi:hypothetical protein